MTYSGDPPRLLELADTPPTLCKLLQSARGDGPSVAEIEQLIHVAGSLAEPFQSGLFLADQLLPQAAARSASLGVFASTGKFFATVVIALSTSALGVVGWSFFQGGALRDSTSRPHVSSPQLTSSERSEAVRAEGSDVPLSNVEVQAPAAVPSTSPKSHGLNTSQISMGVGLSPQSRETSAQSRRTTARHTAASPKVPTVAMPDPEEFRVLQAAREELPGSPAHALVLAESHARRFSRGMLDQERETIAIEALARLGRADEANARSRVFLSRFPASPYRSRVEAAISSSAKQGTKP